MAAFLAFAMSGSELDIPREKNACEDFDDSSKKCHSRIQDLGIYCD